MKEPHLLRAGNCRKIQRNLKTILSPESTASLEAEIERNTRGLLNLGLQHFRFARKLPRRYWRQRVSRCYYGAYNASRALRLYVKGEYSTDSQDHAKVGDLPDDFPETNTFKTLFDTLRADRNSCDYDHECREADLLVPVQQSIGTVDNFLRLVNAYLRSRSGVPK